MKSFQIFWILTIVTTQINAQSILNLSANFETIGATVILSTVDVEKDAYATLKYKESSTSIWNDGFQLSRVDNNLNMCSGSIFWLSYNTLYDIQIEIFDSTTPALNGQTLQGSISTRIEPTAISGGGTILNVNPTGSGTFYTLQNAINIAQAGDLILLDTGNYFIGNITFPNNGAFNNPIYIRGVNKENVILNGEHENTLVWTPYGTNGVYQTTTSIQNPNLVIVDGKRLYPHQTFPDLMTNKITLSYCLPLRKYDAEVGGFYRNPTMTPLLNLCNLSDPTFGDPWGINANKLYIKLLDGSNPNNKKVSVTKRSNCLTFENNQNISISNLTIKNYGVGHIATGVIISNSSNITIDSCNFDANNSSIRLNKNSTNILIQNCNFKDYFFNWNAWKIKATYDEAPFDQRFLYNSRMLERGSLIYGQDFIGNNIVFRRNLIEDYHQGGHITPATSGVTLLDTMAKSLEIDFYENTISNCRGDGFEIDGFARNVRVFKNTFKECHAPLSLAVAEEGPLYILRNTFANIIPDFYDDGSNLAKANGHPLKFQGGTGNMRNGDIFFYHNTIDAQNIAFGMNVSHVTLPNSWKHFDSKNNIFVTDTGIALNVRTISEMPNFESDYNNYFSNNSDIACFNLNNSNQSCYTGVSQLFPLYGIEQHSLQLNPDFVDAINGNYNLNNTSPAINAGIIIQGINETSFNGSKPDMGAFESNSPLSVVENENVPIKIYPNPTCDFVTLELPFYTKDAILKIFDITGKQIDSLLITNNVSEINLIKLPVGTYILNVRNDNFTSTFKLIKSR